MSIRYRPGVPDDVEMDARIERIRERVRPNHDPSVTVRVDESIKRGDGPTAKPVEPEPESAGGFPEEFWRGRREKRCRGCDGMFMPHARSDAYCSVCKARRRGVVEEASEAEPRRAGAATPERDPAVSSPAPASPRLPRARHALDPEQFRTLCLLAAFRPATWFHEREIGGMFYAPRSQQEARELLSVLCMRGLVEFEERVDVRCPRWYRLTEVGRVALREHRERLLSVSRGAAGKRAA